MKIMQSLRRAPRLLLLAVALLLISFGGVVVALIEAPLMPLVGTPLFFAYAMIILSLPAAIVFLVINSVKEIRHREEVIRGQQTHLALLQENLRQAIEALSETIAERDPYIAEHQRHVAEISKEIAKKMGLKEDEVEGIYIAALIHDIGQLYVPTDILGKPKRISPEEFEIVKAHPEVGKRIVDNIHSPWPISDIVMQHHERMDGSGYPVGLSGEDISCGARIVAVADVLEAITAYRPYRSAHTVSYALEHLKKHSGQWYDPKVVGICINLVNERAIAVINERMDVVQYA